MRACVYACADMYKKRMAIQASKHSFNIPCLISSQVLCFLNPKLASIRSDIKYGFCTSRHVIGTEREQEPRSGGGEMQTLNCHQTAITTNRRLSLKPTCPAPDGYPLIKPNKIIRQTECFAVDCTV